MATILRMASNGSAQFGSTDDAFGVSQGYKKIKDRLMKKYQGVFTDEFGPEEGSHVSL